MRMYQDMSFKEISENTGCKYQYGTGSYALWVDKFPKND